MKNVNLATLAICALALLLVALFALTGTRFVEIEFLEATNGDEFPQILQFERMFEGAKEGDLAKFFSFGFYNYGFFYYLLNLALTAPFLAFQNYEAAIFMPRFLQGIFSALNFIALFLILKRLVNTRIALFSALLYISMAGFYSNGVNVKPDNFQGFFVLLSAYFLLRDDGNFGRDYIFSIALLGLGVGLAKFQAVMFIPMIYIYIALPLISRFDFGALKVALKRGICATLAIFALWVVTNPYLIHPRGFLAWLSMFEGNMRSNATNHGAYTKPSLGEKIFGVLDLYYFEILVFCALICGVVWILWRIFRSEFSREKFAQIALIGGFVISLLYLLFFVNKTWQSYYVSTILLGILVLAFAIQAFENRVKWGKIACVVLLMCQIFGGIWHEKNQQVFSEILFRKPPLEKIHARSEIMIRALENLAPRDKIYNILTNNTAFAYRVLNLSPKNIFNVYGHLDPQGFVFAEWSKKPHTFPFTPKDFIVLFKDNAMFSDAPSVDKNLNNSRAAIKALESGAFPYEKVFDSREIVIYKNIDCEHSLICEAR